MSATATELCKANGLVDVSHCEALDTVVSARLPRNSKRIVVHFGVNYCEHFTLTLWSSAAEPRKPKLYVVPTVIISSTKFT